MLQSFEASALSFHTLLVLGKNSTARKNPLSGISRNITSNQVSWASDAIKQEVTNLNETI